MRRILILLLLSIGLMLHTWIYRFGFSQILILNGILLGIGAGIFSIRLVIRNHKPKAVLTAGFAIGWALVCICGSLPVARSGVRFVIKKYYLHTYERERIYFVFKDYTNGNMNGIINFDENWRSVL